TYINMAQSPLISGRIKPFDFEKNLARNSEIDIRVRACTTDEAGHNKLITSLDMGKPVMLYADMGYLSYMRMGDGYHFGGHSIVVCGYDRNKQVFYVSDRDSRKKTVQTPGGAVGKDYHEVPFEEMAIARGSRYRPFPPNRRYLSLNTAEFCGITLEMLSGSINRTMVSFLQPPAQLLGLSGIRKFAREVRRWKQFDEDKLKRAAISNYFMIDQKGGTGGGAFRTMYGTFLAEAAEYLPELAPYATSYLEAAKLWDDIASCLTALYRRRDLTLLDSVSQLADAAGDMEEKSAAALAEITR
ncbi:MAG: BtrH N-terminal domain-containing protein, partial [Spirochaetota bacterium]